MRSKRLRKKLYIDEFAVLGFELSCKLKVKNEMESDLFLDQLIDFVVERNLCLAGGEPFFIFSNNRYGSATEADRCAIKTWLASLVNLIEVNVGDLVDANYGL